MVDFHPITASKVDSTLPLEAPIKMPHTQRQNYITSWFKKTFTATPQPEYTYISKQTSIEGAIWTTSSTKYHPSGYYEVNTGSEISYHGPVSRSKTPFPHARTDSSHAYSSITKAASPTTSHPSEQYRTPSIAHHDTLFVHSHEDTTPVRNVASSHTPGTLAKPQRSNTCRPPNMTYFDYLASINHTYPGSHSVSLHAYSGHEFSTPPPHPRGPRPPRYNVNKDLPEIPYRKEEAKYPHANSQNSHAYDASIPGPTSLSHVRARDHQKALNRLCSYPDTPDHTFPSASGADWERDWDVPLSQRTGTGKVVYQTKGKGLQIRNRESVVALKGKEQRETEAEMFRGQWKREKRVGFVDGGKKDGGVWGKNPFEEREGEETEVDEVDGGMEGLGKMDGEGHGKTGWPLQ